MEDLQEEHLRMEEAQQPVAQAVSQLQGRVEACQAVLALRAQRQADEDRLVAQLEVPEQTPLELRMCLTLHQLSICPPRGTRWQVHHLWC